MDEHENRQIRRITTGSIPWSVSGYLEALQWRAALSRPRDDWDLSPSGPIDLFGESLTFDPHKSGHQFFRWLARRYDPEVAWSHWWRCVVIDEWGTAKLGKLIAWGLIRQDKAGRLETSRALLQALVALPYSRKLRNGDRTFDLQEVLRYVDDRIEEEHRSMS